MSCGFHEGIKDVTGHRYGQMVRVYAVCDDGCTRNFGFSCVLAVACYSRLSMNVYRAPQAFYAVLNGRIFNPLWASSPTSRVVGISVCQSLPLNQPPHSYFMFSWNRYFTTVPFPFPFACPPATAFDGSTGILLP